MNKHNNKRRQDTVRRIENVFLEYLENQDISQINVSHLCEKAKINRGTFYANFTDIYNLADTVLQQLEQEVGNLLERDIRKEYSETDFEKLFEHIEDNQNLYRAYFKLGTISRLDLKAFHVPVQELDFEPETIDYHITFFKNGFNALVRKWLDGGCKETPQQMQKILLREYNGRFTPNLNVSKQSADTL